MTISISLNITKRGAEKRYGAEFSIPVQHLAKAHIKYFDIVAQPSIRSQRLRGNLKTAPYLPPCGLPLTLRARFNLDIWVCVPITPALAGAPRADQAL